MGPRTARRRARGWRARAADRPVRQRQLLVAGGLAARGCRSRRGRPSIGGTPPRPPAPREPLRLGRRDLARVGRAGSEPSDGRADAARADPPAVLAWLPDRSPLRRADRAARSRASERLGSGVHRRQPARAPPGLPAPRPAADRRLVAPAK